VRFSAPDAVNDIGFLKLMLNPVRLLRIFQLKEAGDFVNRTNVRTITSIPLKLPVKRGDFQVVGG